jgi:hypothetical protein
MSVKMNYRDLFVVKPKSEVDLPAVDASFKPGHETKTSVQDALAEHAQKLSALHYLLYAENSVISARERRWFWATMPSKTLVAALIADALTGTVLTRVGLSGLKPLPCAQMLASFGYAMVSCLLVNDAVKVALIKWRVPTAIA